MQPIGITRARDGIGPDGGPRPARPIRLGPLVGVWVNYDERTTGISRVEIADRDGALAVRAFGACEAGPVDWGEVEGAAFADGVDRDLAVGFRADVDLGFMRVLLAAYLNKRLLVVDAYTTFTDASGRSGYFLRDHFYLPRKPPSKAVDDHDPQSGN